MDLATARAILERRTGRLTRLIFYNEATAAWLIALPYDDAIADTVQIMGGSTADALLPTDAEIDGVASGHNPEFLKRAELRQLQNIAGNWSDPNEQAGIDRQEWGKLLDSLLKRIGTLRDEIEAEYGPASAVDQSLVGGALDYDFQQRFDDPFIPGF